MSEWIKELFVTIFGSHSEIATILISMVPIIELRGAIPFGSAVSVWGENALTLWESFFYSVLGSSIVCVFLTFLFWPIFTWLKKTKWFIKLADFIERKLKKNSKNINDKAKEEKNAKKALWLKILGVFAFVAIPLPLTGVWTGTCVALFIGLNKKQTMGVVIVGNVVAGLLMTLISHFVENTLIVLGVFLVLVLLVVLYEIVKSLIEKHKEKKSQQQNIETENEDAEEKASVS